MSSKLVRNLCMAGVLAGLAGAAPENPVKKIEGVLIDQTCSYRAQTRLVPGPRLEGGIVWAYTHTKRCALMPECKKTDTASPLTTTSSFRSTKQEIRKPWPISSRRPKKTISAWK